MAEEEIIIRTKDLVKKYGSITAVDHLKLEIRKGEVFWGLRIPPQERRRSPDGTVPGIPWR